MCLRQRLQHDRRTLNFNTDDTNAPLPVISCAPGRHDPLHRHASPGASFVYLRDGDINVTGGVLTVNHTMVLRRPPGT